MSKPRILAVVDYYLPGFKGGGPIVSVSRLVQSLQHEFEFTVFTRDRDLGDEQPYSGIASNDWNDRDDCRVFYASPDQVTLAALERVISDAKPNIIYLNSYFSKTTRLALSLRQAGKCKGIRFIVAPRGDFSKGALALKGVKKRLYLRYAAMKGIHQQVLWQVSSEHEERDTFAVISDRPKTFVLPPAMDVPARVDRALTKEAGETRFAWISRITPKKNLLGAIELLGRATGSVTFTVYGPVEDDAYWQQCLGAAAKLPSNIQFVHEGGVPSHQVRGKLSQHHFFLFPTFGENFGHVIPEALAAGCPVLLSDQTPWLDLEEFSAGWVLGLEEKAAWTGGIMRCCAMENVEYQLRARACLDYLKLKADEQVSGADLFYAALAA